MNRGDGSTVRSTFFRRHVVRSLPWLTLVALAGCGEATVGEDGPHVASVTPEEAGRYLVAASGCNDCHTDRFMELGTAIPEHERLLGSPVGFAGPWGVTYPANLRLSVQSMSEDQWVEMLGTRTGLPPMPWPSVAAMSEQDRRAIYRYLTHLGPGGVIQPAALAPGVPSPTPWIDFNVRGLPAAAD